MLAYHYEVLNCRFKLRQRVLMCQIENTNEHSLEIVQFQLSRIRITEKIGQMPKYNEELFQKNNKYRRICTNASGGASARSTISSDSSFIPPKNRTLRNFGLKKDMPKIVAARRENNPVCGNECLADFYVNIGKFFGHTQSGHPRLEGRRVVDFA